MKLAPPVIPTSLKGGSRIVARVETVAKGANVDAFVTDWGAADARLNLIGAVPNFANGGAPFTDPLSVSPARPRAFYAGLKATVLKSLRLTRSDLAKRAF